MQNKLPIGIQGFEKIRNDNYLYIDKSEYIYKLVHESVPFFLSRPRRFGKSLLVSTLKAYWEGKKELFEGLKIIDLEKDNPDAWREYPVFHFDFNGQNYLQEGALENILDIHLKRWEEEYGLTSEGKSFAERTVFKALLSSEPFFHRLKSAFPELFVCGMYKASFEPISSKSSLIFSSGSESITVFLLEQHFSHK